MKKKNIYLGIIVTFGFLLSSQQCFAPTATTTFNVTATVQSSCSVAATDLIFPNTYNPLTGANNLQTSTITTTCTNGTTYTIALSTGASGNYASRYMANGANHLLYNLYIDAGRATIWGDGTGGSSLNPNVGNFTGTGAAVPVTVFGQITPAIQNTIPPGAYADNGLTVTVNY